LNEIEEIHSELQLLPKISPTFFHPTTKNLNVIKDFSKIETVLRTIGTVLALNVF